MLEDEAIYRECLARGVHFECCPTSSLLTGAVSLDEREGSIPHAVVRFARDGASFSISTDDPTVTDTKLSNEYSLVTKWGVTISQIQESVCFDYPFESYKNSLKIHFQILNLQNINAMKSSFAEPEVKRAMLTRLYTAYGINMPAI